MAIPNETTPPVIGADLAVVFEHAQRLTAPIRPPDRVLGEPVILVPKGWQPVPVPGWKRETPPPINTRVHLHTVDSFSRYVNDYKTAATQLFAEIGDDTGAFTAILDYHYPGTGTSAWCQHRAEFRPQLSTEWKRWKEVDRKKLTQQAFALFLEDNLATVATPAGADLLQIINTIEVDGKVEFRSAQKLASGSVRLSFMNEQKAKSGELEVPSEFILMLPVFEEEPAVTVTARLRYRLAAGEFSLWFELINPHRVIRDALAQVMARISTGCAVIPLRGVAPLPA